jgi:hypothetical protein
LLAPQKVRKKGAMTSDTNTHLLEKLLLVEVQRRDERWERAFLKALPEAKAHVLHAEPREGPDHWPYLLVSTDEGADDPLINVLRWLSDRGIGLVVNPHKPSPDYVLSYGMIWNLRERGEFLTDVADVGDGHKVPAGPRGLGASSQRFDIKHGQELFVGPPSESYLPKYARGVIKQFFADQGVYAPKVLMVSSDQKNFDLCFSIESLKSPPTHEHKGIAEAISWFLPAHYSVGLVSEKVVTGFQVL